MNVEQLSFEDFRFDGIGGSDAPAIKGVSPWRDSYDVWEEKVQRKSKSFDSPAMKWGRDKEKSARDAFELRYGVAVAPTRLISPVNSWLRGNFDGVDFNKEVCLEIKNIYTNKADHYYAKEQQKPPGKYYPQLQHYLAVTRELGYDMPNIIYNSNFKIGVDEEGEDIIDRVYFEVKRDEDYIATLLKEEKELWDLVLKGTPPERNETKYAPLVGHKKLEQEFKKADSMMDTWAAKRKGALDKLIEAAGGANVRGSIVQLQKQISLGAVDYKKAIAEFMEWLRSTYPDTEWPEIFFDKYRKDSFTKYVPKIIQG